MQPKPILKPPKSIWTGPHPQKHQRFKVPIIESTGLSAEDYYDSLLHRFNDIDAVSVGSADSEWDQSNAESWDLPPAAAIAQSDPLKDPSKLVIRLPPTRNSPLSIPSRTWADLDDSDASLLSLDSADDGWGEDCRDADIVNKEILHVPKEDSVVSLDSGDEEWADKAGHDEYYSPKLELQTVTSSNTLNSERTEQMDSPMSLGSENTKIDESDFLLSSALEAMLMNDAELQSRQSPIHVSLLTQPTAFIDDGLGKGTRQFQKPMESQARYGGGPSGGYPGYSDYESNRHTRVLTHPLTFADGANESRNMLPTENRNMLQPQTPRNMVQSQTPPSIFSDARPTPYPHTTERFNGVQSPQLTIGDILASQSSQKARFVPDGDFTHYRLKHMFKRKMRKIRKLISGE